MGHYHLFILIQMHSHPTRFDNPKLAGSRTGRSEGKEISQATLKKAERSRTAQFKDDHTCGPFGWKPRNLREVAVQRDEGASLSNTGLKYDFICGTRETLLANSHGVVTRSSQEIDSSGADVLVCLKPHSAGSTGSGIIRSRDASAP
jgi:hypothetical protein